MKVAFGLTILACLTAIPGDSVAGCRVRASSRVSVRTRIVVPFAVPVGVPVAAFGTTAYSYQASAAAYQPQARSLRSPEDELLDRLAERLLAKLDERTARAQVTLVSQHCSKCHSGDEAKKGFRVDEPLTDAMKLRAISMVVHDDDSKRMPKGTELDPSVIGDLVEELSKQEPSE